MSDALQIGASPSQLASSATSVASSLSKPKVAATAKTDTSSSTTTSTTDKTTITANDFLTLLVAEMKNQDPTSPTDPNAYITQMVGVNSLQQLISINSGITTLDKSVTTTTTPTTGS